MSPVQTVPKRTRRTLRRRSRTPRSARETESEAAPLDHLRRRCAVGAITASAGYLAVLTTASLRPHAMREPVAYGLLILFAIPASLCALGAVLTWAVTRLPQMPNMQGAEYDRQAQDLMWAMDFGADMADAFHGTSPGRPGGR